MQHSPSVPWRALKAALGLGAAAAASLALAGVASAAVIPITPDGSAGTDHLGAAISTANTNSSTSNTIVLAPGVYTPGASTTNQPFTITKNLNIVADHSFQANNGVVGGTPANGFEINGSNANLKGANNLFVINHGVSVRIDGLNIDAAGGNGFAAILDNGNLTTWGVTFNGSPGYALNVSQLGTATLNESTVSNGSSDQILDAGSLTLNNVSVVGGSATGIDTQAPYTLNLNNTLLAFQVGLECSPTKALGGGATNTGAGSLDDDASCGVQYSNDTAVDAYFPISNNTNGGPATTTMLPAGNPDTTNRGVNCPTVDERFFVNPVSGGATQCDIGSVTNSSTRETAAPSCSVTNTATDHSTQQVTLADTASGVGPEPGAGTDNPSNTVATAYPPPAAVSVPGYAVSNLQINNGSVAFSSPASPSRAGLVLTATKTTAGTTTQWSFTGLNWAGVSRNCY